MFLNDAERPCAILAEAQVHQKLKIYWLGLLVENQSKKKSEVFRLAVACPGL